MTKTTKQFQTINEVLTVIDGLVNLHVNHCSSDWYKVDKPTLQDAAKANQLDSVCCFTFIIRDCGFDSRTGIKEINIKYLRGLERSGIKVVGNIAKTSEGYELKLNQK